MGVILTTYHPVEKMSFLSHWWDMDSFPGPGAQIGFHVRYRHDTRSHGMLLLVHVTIHSLENEYMETPNNNRGHYMKPTHTPCKINISNLNITKLKRKIILQTSIFGFHVNFPEDTWMSQEVSKWLVSGL